MFINLYIEAHSYISVLVFVYLAGCLPPYSLSVYLYVCLSAWLGACLPVCRYLPFFVSGCLTSFLSACLPACLLASLPAFLPACLPAYLPACHLTDWLMTEWLPASCQIFLLFRLAELKLYRTVPYWCMPGGQKEDTTMPRFHKRPFC